jgi:inner membrane protein
MPTIFTHAAFGFALSKLALDAANKNAPNITNNETTTSTNEPSYESANQRIFIASMILAALPDADALLMPWIAYNEPFGHRGFTHSLLCALTIGFAVAFLFLRLKWAADHGIGFLAALFTLVTASHGFFDAMTTGGLGIAFFAPVDNTRYFFSFRPIPVAPLSAAGLLTPRGLNLLLWEFALLWTFAIGALVWHHRKLQRKIAAIVCWLVCLLMWVRKF